MNFRLPAFLLGLALAGAGHAQAPLQLNHVARAWPGTAVGAQSLTVGSFVPYHNGRTAAVAVGGKLYYSFQPALWDHFVEAGSGGVQLVATVAAVDGQSGGLPSAWNGTDRLAAVRADGLRLLQHGPTQFVDAVVGGSHDPSWAGALGLTARIDGTGAARARYVLGWSSTWVKLSYVHATMGLLPVATFPAPPGIAVHDAALVDWNVGGAPEIAILFANGTAVIDLNGTPAAWLPQAAGPGRLCAWRLANAPAVTILSPAAAAGSWSVRTWQPGSTAAGVVQAGGDCPLPSAPVGLLVTHVNDDQWPDLLISHQGHSRLFVPGTATGPNAGNAAALRSIFDVPASSLPSPAPSNQVGAVVTDINLDGIEDLVVASGAMGQLIVQLGLLPQVMSALSDGNGQSGVSGVDQSKNLQLTQGLGLVGEFPVGMTVQSPSINLNDYDLLWLRFSLPTAGSADYSHVRVIVNSISDVGNKILFAGAAHYNYGPIALPPGSPTQLSILVPVPEVVGDYRRFVVEVALTNSDGTKSSPPTLVCAMNLKTDQPGPLAVSYLPIWASLFWWYTSIPFLPQPLNLAGLPSGGGSGTLGPTAGSRYIGLLATIVGPEAEAELAALPPPVPVSGGATQH